LFFEEQKVTLSKNSTMNKNDMTNEINKKWLALTKANREKYENQTKKDNSKKNDKKPVKEEVSDEEEEEEDEDSSSDED
jgi:hypothetical protein